jgi:hypothetical protein
MRQWTSMLECATLHELEEEINGFLDKNQDIKVKDISISVSNTLYIGAILYSFQ